MKRTSFFVATALAAALVAGGVSYGVVRHASDSRSTSFAADGAGVHFTAYEGEKYPDLTYAAENAVKAVVGIEKTQEVAVRSRSSQGYDPFFEFFGIPQGSYEQQGTPRQQLSGGSGVIISADGYIVTNNHVVENATKLKVKLSDGRSFSAKLIGTDPTTDVALIKIDQSELPTLAFGDSDQMRLGEWVLAIGSPYDLPSTVTAGIVSAKARSLSVIPSQLAIESFIQTDAAVNPGNSGGALVNVRGELIGINTLIKSPTGTYTGYSFAVPAAIVKKVVVDLREHGMVQRAVLGVTFQEINEAFIEREGEAKNISQVGGVYVTQVDPDGAAAAAGIKQGDVIGAIDGVKIENSSTLLEQIGRHRPGDKVNLEVKRGSTVKQFAVTLRNRAGKAELLAKDWSDAIEALGGTFADLSDEGRKKLKIDGGVVVTGINPDGILAKARVRRQYVITHINERPVKSLSELSKTSGKISSIDGVYPDGREASYSLIN